MGGLVRGCLITVETVILTLVSAQSRPSTLVQIMEETLRNLYSHTTDAHILTVASGAFSIMEGDREEIILEVLNRPLAVIDLKVSTPSHQLNKGSGAARSAHISDASGAVAEKHQW